MNCRNGRLLVFVKILFMFGVFLVGRMIVKGLCSRGFFFRLCSCFGGLIVMFMLSFWFCNLVRML